MSVPLRRFDDPYAVAIRRTKANTGGLGYLTAVDYLKRKERDRQKANSSFTAVSITD